MSKKSKRPRQNKISDDTDKSGKKKHKEDDWGYDEILRSKKSGRRQN